MSESVEMSNQNLAAAAGSNSSDDIDDNTSDNRRASWHNQKSAPQNCGEAAYRWVRSQVYGWKKDENGEYHGIWKRYHLSSLRKLIEGEDLSIPDLDSAVGTIAFMNAIVITIPYGIMTALSPDFFASLDAALTACPSNSVLGSEPGDLFEQVR